MPSSLGSRTLVLGKSLKSLDWKECERDYLLQKFSKCALWTLVLLSRSVPNLFNQLQMTRRWSRERLGLSYFGRKETLKQSWEHKSFVEN